MKKQMIISGLRARPVRTSVTILAVTLEVVLILVIIGLTRGITEETARRTAGVGAELMVQPPDADVLLATAENSMPLSLGDKLRELPGVKAVSPVMVKMTIKGNIEVVYGIDSHFTEVTGGFRWLEGGPSESPNEIIVDDLWAKAHAAAPGNTIKLMNTELTIAGIVDHGQGSRVFMSIDDLSTALGQPARAGVFYVKVKDPEQVQIVKGEIEQLLKGYTVRDMKMLASLYTASNIPGLDYFIKAVVAIALIIGTLVIFLSMYTTITERTREIGILRAMGASKAFIVGLIFQETTVVCILGVVFGTGASFFIQRTLAAAFPTLMIEITRDWIVRAAVFAVLSGVIGSFYPSLKAASQDPVEALAYE
jgi:putative ABC transport system permease protein